MKIRRSTRSLLSVAGTLAVLTAAPMAQAQDGATPPATPPAPAAGPTAPATAPADPSAQGTDDPNDPKKKKPQPAAAGTEAPPAGATAATAGATSATTGGSGGIVSLVSGNPPPKDQVTPGAGEAPKKEPKKLFWAASQFYISTSVNQNVFVPSAQQTAAQTVETFMLFQPRFALDKKHLQLRVRVAASYEWTDTASTGSTRKNEFMFQDIIPSLWLRSIPVIPKVEIKVMPYVQAAIPTSQGSQMRHMYVAPGAGVQFVKGFEHFLGGELDLIVNGVFIHPFYEYTTGGTVTPAPYAPSCYSTGPDSTGGSCVMNQGAASVENQMNFSFIASAEWGKWSPGAFLLLANQWVYKFRDLPGVATGEELGLQGPTNFRQSTFFSAWLDYHVNSWLTPEIGYQMFRNILDGRGQVGNPIWDINQDMRFYLAVNIGLDKLYQAISGEGGEGGVVRAQNNPRRGGMIRF